MKGFIALLVASSFLNAAEPVALFNGRDLRGWTFDIIDPDVRPDALWSVVDGVLVCKGRPPGVMRTTTEYADYELVVEWRWPPGQKPGNSGVLVHASIAREMFIWPKSLEVQLRDGDAGDFWMIGVSVTVEDREPVGRLLKKQGTPAEKPAGEWNTAVIRCENDTITVHVNGTLMNHGTALTATRGAVCLQSEGGEIHFRKVELSPLATKSAEISEDSR
jgi:hypothetical protein